MLYFWFCSYSKIKTEIEEISSENDKQEEKGIKRKQNGHRVVLQ